MNTLYYGDNLKILRNRDYFPNESVDLIYLDPPFNSNRSYNVLFKDESGIEADSQIKAFDDTWHWPNAAPTYHELLEQADNVAEMLNAFHAFLRSNQMMAYLVMMAARLKELHRVLKQTGSLYLHCDPTASHYLKVLLDTIFGAENFRNEVVWKRTTAHSSAKRWGDVHDTLLFYSRSLNYTWNRTFQEYDEAYLGTKYKNEDARGVYRLSDLTGAGTTEGDSGKPWRGFDPAAIGRHWAVPGTPLLQIVTDDEAKTMSTQQKLDLLDSEGFIYWTPKGRKGGVGFPQWKRYLGEGVPITSVIGDISPINSMAQERIGYPTQKPVELLERIISASSNEGDIVLDPFAGCGTTVAAAQKLNRQWLGIDVTQLSIALLKSRLERDFGLLPKRDYKVVGEPEDLHDAIKLVEDGERYQFQYWALSHVNATPLGGQVGGRSGKVGADRGIDGLKYFVDDKSGKHKKVVIQVKSGNVSVAQMRDLIGTVDREKAAIGVFISLLPPTQPMLDEAANAGVYKGELAPKLYPRIQILTIEEILSGKQIQMPPSHFSDVEFSGHTQRELFGEAS